MTSPKRERFDENSNVYQLFDVTDEEDTSEESTPIAPHSNEAIVSTPGGSNFGYVLDGNVELMLNQAISRAPTSSDRRTWLEAISALRMIDQEAGSRVQDSTWRQLLNWANTSDEKSDNAELLFQLDSLAMMYVMADDVGVGYPVEVWQLLLRAALSDHPPTSESWEHLKAIGGIWRETEDLGFHLTKDDLKEMIDQLLSELRFYQSR